MWSAVCHVLSLDCLQVIFPSHSSSSDILRRTHKYRLVDERDLGSRAGALRMALFYYEPRAQTFHSVLCLCQRLLETLVRDVRSVDMVRPEQGAG